MGEDRLILIKRFIRTILVKLMYKILSVSIISIMVNHLGSNNIITIMKQFTIQIPIPVEPPFFTHIKQIGFNAIKMLGFLFRSVK